MRSQTKYLEARKDTRQLQSRSESSERISNCSHLINKNRVSLHNSELGAHSSNGTQTFWRAEKIDVEIESGAMNGITQGETSCSLLL